MRREAGSQSPAGRNISSNKRIDRWNNKFYLVRTSHYGN